MAKFEDLPNKIDNLDTEWDGHSGMEVEDFISRNLENLDKADVKSIQFDSASQKLTLYNKDEEEIASTEVSIAEPIYNQSIEISKVYIDNQDVTNNDSIVCKLGSKIELGVLYKFTAENPLTGQINYVSGKQNLSIKLPNSSYIQVAESIISKVEEQKIDITKYITNTTVGVISLRVTTSANISSDIKTVEDSTDKQIAVLNPTLQFTGNNYIVNRICPFEILNGGSGIDYSMQYTITHDNSTTSINRTSNLSISLTDAGINIIEANLVVSGNESIKFNSIKVKVINIYEQDSFESLQCVVNEISKSISNWEYSKLYRVTIYAKGTSLESISLNSLLTSTADEEDIYFDKVKEIDINSLQNYTYQQDINYFFGIEGISGDINANLVVKVNGEDIISFDDIQQLQIKNDSQFTYTSGYTYSFDQYDPDNSNIITKEVLGEIESPDGLVQDNELTAFRVSAKNYSRPALKRDLSSELTTNGFTLELDFKSYNISDLSQSVLKLGRFILYPTELNWQFSEEDDSIDKTARSALFQEDERTHLLIEVVPNFKAVDREIPEEVKALANKTISIVRIFINGVIDREYKYVDLSDFSLNGFNLEIAPTGSDIDIYTLRVYNKALTLQELSANYISTMSNLEQKKSFQKQNDIIKVDSKGDSYISYNLTKEQYNTLVYVLPKTVKYPHQFNTIKDNKYKNCTLFVNYVNNKSNPMLDISEQEINKCSGRFTDCEIKGQGTSAMKYYWYNIQTKSKKFTSKACYDKNLQEYIEPNGLDDPNKLYNHNGYYLPNNPAIGITKLVGKTNYASSMQSHKLGSTMAFHDLWNACVDKSDFNELELKGRRAVLEFPFIAFYIETELDDVSNFTPKDINDTPDEDIKFASFQTWGSAKGDDETYGYNADETPGYLLLEGAENSGKLCNFLVPWMPNNIVLDGETYKTIGYGEGGAKTYFDSFDVDYGLAEDSETELSEAAKLTMKKFIEAYNFAYMHTINLQPYKETYSLNDPRNSGVLDITQKYYITNSRYQDSTYFSGAQWDVFRYDQSSELWVPAGLPKLSEDGNQKAHPTIVDSYSNPVYDYEVFNLKTWYTENGGVGNDSITNFTNLLISDFKEKFGTYFHVKDILYHQAFIKLFAGTDNRAKNTYFKLVDENSKICLLQDDMDTLLATDNRGLQKKPYFLIEPSGETEAEYKNMWGGSSAFFELVDIAYKSEITTMLKSILEQFGINQEPSIHDWMTKYFYFVQEYYPAQAYNYTARLAYESAQIFFDNQGSVGITWQNNGQDPVSQAHGSCLQSEKEFMKKRLIMFLSQVQISNIFGREGMGINIKASEDSNYSGTYTMDITPYQYLYLGYNVGSNVNLYSPDRQKEGVTKTVTIKIDSTTPLYSILGARYIKDLKGFEKIHWNIGTYNLSAKRLLEMSANGTESFKPPVLALDTPVLKKLDLTGVSSLTTIDLGSDKTPKLEEVYLTGTNIATVTLPQGSRLNTVHFSKALTSLSIINNAGLEDVQFESLENLADVTINCSKCGKFDVSDFCEKLINVNTLQSVTLRNANLHITEDALRKLIFTNTCSLTGDIYIVDSAGNTTLKAISFATKQLLVNTFGDISDPKSEIRIYFKSAEISDFSCAREVSVYYQTGESGTIVRQNPFDITVAFGNDVEIKQGTNPYNPSVNGYLDITYSMSGVSSDVATIDQAGAITLKKESSNTATVTISMKVANNGTPIRKTVEVSFAWKAPQLGDFAYADGTFTSSFDDTKTLVGLVYAKDENDSTSGTVYIIGKEYTDAEKSYYSGYSPDGNSGSPEQILRQLYQVQAYLSSKSISNYETVSGTTTANLINNINVSTYNIQVNTTFAGKSDTELYINHVNSKLLPVLYDNSACRPYISRKQSSSGSGNSWKYYIESKSDLNNLCEAIQAVWDNASETDIMSCLLYPYFYSMQVYEPSVKERETLNSAYKKGNWYAPSVAEFSRIIYYRGYSVSGSNFNTGDIVRQPINTSVVNGGGVLTTPIFSIAYSRANNQFPSVWSNIVGSGDNAGVNNITTSINSSDADNYSYQRVQQYDGGSGSYVYSNEWVCGNYNDSSFWNSVPYNNAWRLTKHRGIPFTKFNYSKNGQ